MLSRIPEGGLFMYSFIIGSVRYILPHTTAIPSDANPF